MWKCKRCGEEDCFNQIIVCGTRWGVKLDRQQDFAYYDEDIEYYWECFECCKCSIGDDLEEIADWIEEQENENNT